MNLPITQLSEITSTLQGKPAEAAFPVNLSDKHLHQIARDLLACEKARAEDSDVQEGIDLSTAEALILHMMMGLAEKHEGRTTFNLSEDQLHYWLERYMYFIEREIVSRKFQISRPADTSQLHSEIIQEIGAKQRVVKLANTRLTRWLEWLDWLGLPAPSQHQPPSM